MMRITRSIRSFRSGRGPSERLQRYGSRAVAAVLLLLVLPAPVSPQKFEPSAPHWAAVRAPFGVGEVLTYDVRLGRLGGGSGTMRVDGTEVIRGIETWSLAFDFSARVALARVRDRSRSWIDPGRMASMRYHKHERSPLSSHDERVEIFPGEKRWIREDGTSSASPDDEPLDELSFIYFIRTLDLRPGDVHTFNRHFDVDRNPVTIRVGEREHIHVPAGEFATIVVEMEVTDRRRYGGSGVIRFHISDDSRRLPVRIESSMPLVGSAVLSLEEWTPGENGR